MKRELFEPGLPGTVRNHIVLPRRISGPYQPNTTAMLRKTKLVGRALQQAELEEACRASAAGRFRCAVLSGDPGVGKSRLASETVGRTRNAIALTARAYPLGETAPMGLWAEAFEGHLRGRKHDEVAALCGGFLDDLATLLHSVAAVRGSVPEQDPPRARLLQAMVGLLGNLARRSPVHILLDDLHLADASSWEALHYLARNLEDSPILIVASARAAELDGLQIAREVLTWMDKDQMLVRIPVPPLDPQAVGELAEEYLEESPSETLVEWLVDKSRGNAMFALSLLQALVEQGADLAAPQLRSLPEALAGAVRARLEGLDQAAIATLELMAVVGQRVEFEELVRLTARPLDRLEVILNKLVRSRLVIGEERGLSLTYEVAHPLIREVIVEGIGPARRRSVHRLVGRGLVEAGRLGAAAPHFVHSAGIGDDEAVEVLQKAVAQAEKREAYREALTILNSLVKLLPAGDERWLEVVDALSWQAEWVLDHRADAHAPLGLEATREIDRLLEVSGDPARRAAVKFRLASFLSWGSGELEEAESQCRQALSLFEQAGDHRSVLHASVELAWVASLQGRFTEAADQAMQVVEVARSRGETLALMHAGAVKGYQQLAMGEFGPGEAVLRQAADLARQAGNEYRLATGLAALALNLALQGRIPESLEQLSRARRVYPRYVEAVVLEWSAMANWYAGNFPAVVRFAEEALSVNPGGLSRRRGYALPFAAGAAVEAGRMTEAESFARQARELYGTSPWSFCCDYVSWAEAQVLAGRQRWEEAAALLGPAVDSILKIQAWPWAAPLVLDQAELAFHTGDGPGAREAAIRLEQIAGKVDRDLYRGLAEAAQAWARLTAGDTAPAAESARRAVDLLTGTGCRAFTARALEIRGRALGDRDRHGAIEALEQASWLFDRCGSPARRERALAELAALGTKGRRAAAGVRGPESLTDREREVVLLARRGLTAKQIGAELFIGARTVETHLSNAYAKLGITSRMQLMGVDLQPHQ